MAALSSPDVLAGRTEASAAIATRFFLATAPSPGAALLESIFDCAASASEAVWVVGTGTAVLTGTVRLTAAELLAGAALAEETGGRAAPGVAAGVFFGVFLGVAAPWGFLLGEGGRLGCSLLDVLSLRDEVKTASGPTAR